MAENTKTPRKTVDWEAVELHYRAGIRSLKDIGKEYEVSDAGIIKKAKAQGWTRDLAAKIKAKAEAKVSAAAVSAEVSAARTANEQVVVEANAELQYQVRMRHRGDIAALRALFLSLLEEVKLASSPEGLDALETLQQLLHEGESDPDDPEGVKRAQKMRDSLMRALSTGSRIDSAKKLTEMLEKLVRMEREAFGIDDGDKGGSEIDKLLAKLHGGELS